MQNISHFSAGAQAAQLDFNWTIQIEFYSAEKCQIRPLFSQNIIISPFFLQFSDIFTKLIDPLFSRYDLNNVK